MYNRRRDVDTVVHRVIRRRRERWRPRDGSHPAIVSRARAWGRRILPKLVSRPVRPGLGEDLDLVLSELVTNAIRHGGRCVEVELHTAGDMLRLSVTDTRSASPVVPPAGEASGQALDEALGESGRGMLLVQAIARRWGVRRVRRHTGKAVWLDLPLHLEPA